MDWESLKLWADGEEKRIHECIVNALRQLINSNIVKSTDNELIISGKLRPFIRHFRNSLKIVWTLHSEASVFRNETDPKPIGHPDFRFSGNTPYDEQYDYDIECKLIRIKRPDKDWDYCEHYVIDGIQRFQDGKYAQSIPAMGTMIGYIQEGNELLLLQSVNLTAEKCGLKRLNLVNTFQSKDVSYLSHVIARSSDNIDLQHLWTDLR